MENLFRGVRRNPHGHWSVEDIVVVQGVYLPLHHNMADFDEASSSRVHGLRRHGPEVKKFSGVKCTCPDPHLCKAESRPMAGCNCVVSTSPSCSIRHALRKPAKVLEQERKGPSRLSEARSLRTDSARSKD
jgi:hypothetical protein